MVDNPHTAAVKAVVATAVANRAATEVKAPTAHKEAAMVAPLAEAKAATATAVKEDEAI